MLTHVYADAAPPAGGAAIGQVFGLSATAALVSAALLGVAYLHRTRKITWLGDLADKVGSRSRLPGWAALPSVLVTISLITALFGFWWDVSLHIGRGRDDGPLANPAHYFILVGLFAMFIAGMLASCSPSTNAPARPRSESPATCTPRPVASSSRVRTVRPSRVPAGRHLAPRLRPGRHPLGADTPDDDRRRGPSLIGVLVLDREARLSVGDTGTRPKDTSSWLLKVGAAGALVIGLSAFQGEYDFGVEQFRLVLQPMMITGAAALALVAARMLLGRGGAVLAALFFLLLRGIISVLVGPVLGEPQVWFPLYLSERRSSWRPWPSPASPASRWPSAP